MNTIFIAHICILYTQCAIHSALTHHTQCTEYHTTYIQEQRNGLSTTELDIRRRKGLRKIVGFQVGFELREGWFVGQRSRK